VIGARPQREPAADDASLVLAPLAQASVEKASDGVIEKHPEIASPRSGEPPRPTPQLGSVLAGTLPFDLSRLERAVEEFFIALGNLAGHMSTSLNLTEWLLAAVVAAGAYEFARKRGHRSESGVAAYGGGGRTPSLAPFPVLAIVLPEDEP